MLKRSYMAVAYSPENPLSPVWIPLSVCCTKYVKRAAVIQWLLVDWLLRKKRSAVQIEYFWNLWFLEKFLVWSQLLMLFLSPLSHWQKSFATFGLGCSLQLLVANWKKYPRKFHWQRGFLALATVVRLGLIGVN